MDLDSIVMPRVITFCEFGFLQRIQGGQPIDDENRNLLASLSRLTETDEVNMREITDHGDERSIIMKDKNWQENRPRPPCSDQERRPLRHLLELET